MKKSIWAFVLAVTCLPFTAQGAFVNLIAQTGGGAAGLDGASEVPSVVTGASGSAGLVFDTNTNEFSWSIAAQDLESDFTVAHFHGPAAVDEAGPIVLSIEPTSRTQGDGVLDRGGSAINNIVGSSGFLLGSAPITADEASDLLAGLWYINIHSVENGGGEIRGQVVPAIPAPVPLPAAAWLFISAFGLLGFRFKRCASM